MTTSVLYITRKWPPAMGGMETYSVELVSELSQDAHVEVISLAGKPDGSPPSFLALCGFAVHTFARTFRLKQVPDVVHIGDMASWPLALAGWLRRPSPTIVISAHGTDVSYHRRGGIKGNLYALYLKIGAKLLRHSRVISNSAATAAAALENGWKTDAVIPLGTRNTPQDGPAGIDPGLLFAGRLVERKGFRWFAENVLPLLPGDIGIKVAGTVWDEKEGLALEDPRVTFLGPLPADQLNAAYRSALAVIIPNIEPKSGEFEGFGLVAPEAAVAGGVVIAARTGGLIEAVMDGETGFLVEAGSAEAWRDRLAEVAAWDTEKRDRFTTNASRAAQSHYDWRRVADEVMGVYLSTRGSL